MFDAKKSTNYQLQFTNEIGSGSKVYGNLEGNGNMRVSGHFVGNILEAEGSSSTLVIDKEGVLSGDLHYSNLIVAGTIEGSITVDEKMVVYPSAMILGNIRYKSIDIHPDARVNGILSCEALDVIKNNKSEVITFEPIKKIAS